MTFSTGYICGGAHVLVTGTWAWPLETELYQGKGKRIVTETTLEKEKSHLNMYNLE
jgi:hypothetical protein